MNQTQIAGCNIENSDEVPGGTGRLRRKVVVGLCTLLLPACLTATACSDDTLPTRDSTENVASSSTSDSRSAITDEVLETALQSITVENLRRHIEFLASDTLQGRAAGTEGSYAAAAYLTTKLRESDVQPLQAAGEYYQYFYPNYRNILAVVRGGDDKLRDEFILIAAHYDHVGYGNRNNSRGPIGVIHNGADDNASGTAAVLEAARVIQSLARTPRRSLLFVFWDGEEQGLLGSRHYVAAPLVPMNRIRISLNADMVGRYRPGRFEIYGWRTAPGLRKSFVQHNRDALQFDFTWSYRPDSDHWPFFERGIPSVMLHTGKHDDYHRPTDDVHLINFEGARDVTRLLVRLALNLADADSVPAFRQASFTEITQDEPAPKVIEKPSRLGISYDGDLAVERRVVIKQVASGKSADKAGLRPDDEITSINGRLVSDFDDFRMLVNAASSPARFTIRRDGDTQSLDVVLAGESSGAGWSLTRDDAEPGVLIVTGVLPASPAAIAGLQFGDRIISVDGQLPPTPDELSNRFSTATDSLHLSIETHGNIREVKVVSVFPPQDAEATPLR